MGNAIASRIESPPWNRMTSRSRPSAIPPCGGATAPCPTPTTELDQLRDRSERLEEDLARATREDRKVSAQREEAGRRIEAAQAALDSIARAKKR